jgi:hypothetical protein
MKGIIRNWVHRRRKERERERERRERERKGEREREREERERKRREGEEKRGVGSHFSDIKLVARESLATSVIDKEVHILLFIDSHFSFKKVMLKY